jgi:hypothetical protein
MDTYIDLRIVLENTMILYEIEKNTKNSKNKKETFVRSLCEEMIILQNN